MTTDLELARELADIADAITVASYRSISLRVETKPDLTPVTEADKAVEQAIRKILQEKRPDDGIVGEEFASIQAKSNRTWVIDPIDATKNYVRGVPVWATLIGLLQDGVPILGFVSAPAMARRWWAQSGNGAFTKDVDGTSRQISVSAISSLQDASFSYSDSIGWVPEALSALQKQTWRSRAFGDFWSHLLVAEGAVDIAAEPELNAWDMVAFAAIVTEAGGKVTGFNGKDLLVAGNALSTNRLLHESALKIVAQN